VQGCIHAKSPRKADKIGRRKKLKRKSTRLCLAPIKDTNETLFKYNIINNLGISILHPGWFFLISLRATESLSCIARASVAWPSMSPLRLPNPSNLPTKVWSLLYPGTFSRSTTTVQQKHGHHVPTPTPWRQVIGVVRQIFHFCIWHYQWISNLQSRKTQP